METGPRYPSMPHLQLPNCESSYRRLLMMHAEVRPGPPPQKERDRPSASGSPAAAPSVRILRHLSGSFGRGQRPHSPRVRNANPGAWFALSGQSIGAGPISRAEAET
ncbi:unnamed protein product [Rangifer tarandus platyrhynchus]|uniref:Uncharacterized protein n=1 Tax=Rangifer tarandus platyrhynchus TaxID=3082113 RepID=A0ABN8Z0B5_RANTA|nr:unnamed protein product [Rangifer tarandus platyrhynchus]